MFAALLCCEIHIFLTSQVFMIIFVCLCDIFQLIHNGFNTIIKSRSSSLDIQNVSIVFV